MKSRLYYLLLDRHWKFLQVIFNGVDDQNGNLLGMFLTQTLQLPTLGHIQSNVQSANYMDQFLISVVVPLISSAMTLGGLLSISLLQLPTIRKNMHTGVMEQIYARIMEARIRLENTDTFTHMARESPVFAERFALVDNPQEYYTVMSFIDLIEFLHRLNKTQMINTEVWPSWEALSKTMMTIPKFKAIWNKIKDIHTAEFRQFIDSL